MESSIFFHRLNGLNISKLIMVPIFRKTIERKREATNSPRDYLFSRLFCFVARLCPPNEIYQTKCNLIVKFATWKAGKVLVCISVSDESL